MLTGFGIVILLLVGISMVSLICLTHADRHFKDYRVLARQTVATARVSAYTRDHAHHAGRSVTRLFAGCGRLLTRPVGREQLRKALGPYYRNDKPSAVMLVEDDLEIRNMMARTLEKDGWAVSEVDNGQEALDLLALKSPDLIILDLMMPVLDGFGFLAEMRVRPDWQHIRVIVVTARELTADDKKQLGEMVEQVLEKNSYTPEPLFERVRDAVVACNLSRETKTEEANQDEQDTAG